MAMGHGRHATRPSPMPSLLVLRASRADRGSAPSTTVVTRGEPLASYHTTDHTRQVWRPPRRIAPTPQMPPVTTRNKVAPRNTNCCHLKNPPPAHPDATAPTRLAPLAQSLTEALQPPHVANARPRRPQRQTLLRASRAHPVMPPSVTLVQYRSPTPSLEARRTRHVDAANATQLERLIGIALSRSR